MVTKQVCELYLLDSDFFCGMQSSKFRIQNFGILRNENIFFRFRDELVECGKVVFHIFVVIRVIEFQRCYDGVIKIEIEKMSFVFARFYEEVSFFYEGVVEIFPRKNSVENIPDIFFCFRVDSIALIIKTWY